MYEKKIIATKVLDSKSKIASVKLTRKLIERTLKAVSTDKTRIQLTLGFWDNENKALVATDGKRLHFLQGVVVDDFFSDIDVNCFVELQGNIVLLYDAGFALFPNWQRVVPGSEKLRVIEHYIAGRTQKNILGIDFSTKSEFEKNFSQLIILLGAPFDIGAVKDLIGGCYQIHKNIAKDTILNPCLLVQEEKYYKFSAVFMPMTPFSNIIEY